MDSKVNPLKPLVVDLDGTLLRSDILLESFFSFLKSAPLSFYKPFFWLVAGGKTNLKAHLVEQINITVEHLPYDEQVVGWLHKEKASGRRLVLATASHEAYAKQISNHLGLFDQVLATNRQVNLSAENKRNVLVNQFGEKGFDYVGNSMDDLHVWQAADRAFVVNPEYGVEKLARSQGNVEGVIKSDASSFKSWVKAMRLHQWLKNLLIFVPPLSIHQLSSLPAILTGFEAFVFFGLCASSVYLLNDLFDLEDDRLHFAKKHRPLASGTIPIKSVLLAIPLLLVLAFTGSVLTLPSPFIAVLAVYYALTLSYSLVFKRITILDVLVVAALYTLRIIAGGLAFNLPLTFWLLAFSIFIFIGLAFIQRYAELRDGLAKG